MKQNKMREEMAAEFVSCLKENKIPWQCEWNVIKNINGVTKSEYKGINMIWLNYAAEKNGWKDPRWVTFNQAREKGWSVKKGSRGTHIEFWSVYDIEQKKTISFNDRDKILKNNPNVPKERFSLISRNYTVFNGDQIDGIPPLESLENFKLKSSDFISLRDNLLKNMKVGFSEGGNESFYTPNLDSIQMPKIESFKDEYGYIATFLHEAGHATGHPTRLNRDLSGTFGSESYAKEELRAEISSAFTAAQTGIAPANLDNHKAYIQSWADVIENDPNELFRAIKDAEKISDYLLEKGEFETLKKELAENIQEAETNVVGLQNLENSESYKATITVSEDELLKIASKIEQNKKEEKAFKEQLHRLIEGDKKLASRPLIIGQTPNSLVICGADESYDLQILKSVVDKALRPEIRDENGKLIGKTGHGLTEKQLINAIENIKNPVMILRGSKDDSLVAVTEIKDNNNRYVFVTIDLNKKTRYGEVNNITSSYGRDDIGAYFEREFSKGNLLSVNIEKADKALHAIGKWYPEGNTLISFDNSIAYSTANVKGFLQKNFQKSENLKGDMKIPSPNQVKSITIDDKLFDEIMSKYDAYYSFFVEHKDFESSKSYHDAQDACSAFINDRELSDSIMKKYFERAGDFLSSDREYASFAFALADAGVIDNFSNFSISSSTPSVALPEFHKSESGYYQAKAVYSGKSEWKNVLNDKDKWYIRLDDGKRYFFNERQEEKFKEFSISSLKKESKAKAVSVPAVGKKLKI